MIDMRKICVLLLSLFTVHLSAQFANYQVVNGFSPKNDLRTILFDPSDRLYIGTYAGIYKQDNKEWQLCSPEELYLESCILDAKGKIWVTGWGAGVSWSDNGGKDYERIPEIPTSANILLEDKTGQVWVGLWTGGLLMYDSNKWTTYKAEEHTIADNSIMSLACDSDNTLWIGTFGGLTSFDGKIWKSYSKKNNTLPDNNIYALTIAKNNRVWVGTCAGLFCMNKQGIIENSYTMDNSPIPNNVILSLAEDRKGNLWIGTNRGLTCFDGQKWVTYTMENSNILENRVQVLKVYKDKLYIGTSLGLSVLDL